MKPFTSDYWQFRLEVRIKMLYRLTHVLYISIAVSSTEHHMLCMYMFIHEECSLYSFLTLQGLIVTEWWDTEMRNLQ
jgi:hypothetical protein